MVEMRGHDGEDEPSNLSTDSLGLSWAGYLFAAANDHCRDFLPNTAYHASTTYVLHERER